MGKANKNKSLPTIQKMGEMGFQDGYSGQQSRENEFLRQFCNRGINNETIKDRLLSYCLGYKKGKLFLTNSLSSFKASINDGEVKLNGKLITIDEYKKNSIGEKIKKLSEAKKWKRGRKNYGL